MQQSHNDNSVENLITDDMMTAGLAAIDTTYAPLFNSMQMGQMTVTELNSVLIKAVFVAMYEQSPMLDPRHLTSKGLK